MKTIKVNLSQDIDRLELVVFADEHIGDHNCDLDRLRERIAYVRDTENAYCILNGDILDYASRSSIGDIETRDFNIMEQLQKAVELFAPIKSKVLAITGGNHEARAYRKEGIDISKMIALQLELGDRYTMGSAAIFLSFGRQPKKKHEDPVRYVIFCNHGSGGGRKEGAKALRLADMASIIDADVYIHSHTHLPMIMKQGYFRVDTRAAYVEHVTKLFVNTSANLDYGGYGEIQEYKPTSKDTPTIFLSGSRREMTAKL